MYYKNSLDNSFVFGTEIPGSSPCEIAKDMDMDNYKKIFWLSSYPRSGNTWLRLILCGLFFTKDGNINNFDLLNKIHKLDSLNYFKFIKEISINDYNLIFEGTEYNWEMLAVYTKYWVEAQKRIKINEGTFAFFKTHNARVKLKENHYTNELTTLGFIYISRDPRDIVLSYSKHRNKDIDATIDDLLSNDTIIGKFKTENRMLEILLSWKDHYRSWKKFTAVPNLFLKYEDLVNDIEREINNIIDFFYSNFNIEISNKNEKIKNIIKSTNFNNLQSMESKNGFDEKSEYSDFFRSGKTKQWESALNQDQKNLIEQSCKNQMIELEYL